MKRLRIILFVVIVVGLGLLMSQTYWLPPLVTALLGQHSVPRIPLDTQTDSTSTPTTTPSNIDNWQWVYSTTSASGIQFKYPDPIPATYITAVDWPPQVNVSSGTVSCVEGDMASHSGEVTTSKQSIIQNRQYCVSESKQGAAGTTYTTYHYVTQQGDLVASVAFTLKTPQCLNYDEPKQSNCITEQKAFSVDALAYQIIESITRQ